MNLNNLMENPSTPNTEVSSQPINKAFAFNDILTGDGSPSQELQPQIETPPAPAIQMPLNQIYYIPIRQTPLQKELVRLILDLHRSNFVKQLKRRQLQQGAIDLKLEEESYEYLSDESMVELFLQNIENISVHNSLLVSHYIPSKILQMITKKNVTFGSSKFQVLDRILNSLVETSNEEGKATADGTAVTATTTTTNNSKRNSNKANASNTDIQSPKKIIITAANSKELDLIESLLLGKKYRYYRFSGSSIYYENHGTFNYNYQAQVENSTEQTSKSVKGKKRAYNRKSKTDTSTSSNTGNGTGKREYKKKNTTASKAEKKSSLSGSGSQSQSASNGQQQSNRLKKRRAKDDEYFSPFSKNNPISIDRNDPSNPHRFNHNIQICLILSNQIKSLLYNNREYEADLVLSLDSNLSEIQAVHNNQLVFVPILKFVPLNSTEHIILKIKEIMKTLTGAVDPEYLSSQKELVAYLTIINSFEDENSSEDLKESHDNGKDDDEKLNEVMKWIEDPSKVQFPYSLNLDDIKSIQLETDEIVNKALELLSDDKDDRYKPIALYKNSKYKYFKSDNSTIVEQQTKKPRIADYDDDHKITIDDRMSLATYRSKLASLFFSRYQYFQHLNEKAKEELNSIHGDETKRQNYLETKTEEIKHNFSKLQKDKVSATNIDRQVEKNESDLNKLKESIEVLKTRESSFSEKLAVKEMDSEVLTTQEEEIQKLTDELQALELEITTGSEQIENVIRLDYQQKSNKAAELSLEMTNLSKLKESLTSQINGPSQQLKDLIIEDELIDLNISIKKIKGQNQFVELHLNKLKGLIKERSALFSNVMSSRSSRHSRSSTPY